MSRPALPTVRVGLLAWAGVLLWLAGCPAPTPSSPRKAPPASDPAPAPSEAAAQPTPTPGEPAEPTPTEPTPEVDPDLPAALAGASPATRLVWSSMEAVDDGDVGVLSQAMHPTARWFPPGSLQESVGNIELERALASWAGPSVTLHPRRLIDAGDQVVLQVAARHAGNPAGFEVGLVFEIRQDQIAMVRQYGDPLGPVRPRPEDTGATLDLGPPDALAVSQGEADPALTTVVEALSRAIEARDEAAMRAVLGRDVVLHEVKERRNLAGPEAYAKAMTAAVGEKGHQMTLGTRAVGDRVIVEGAIYGVTTDEDGSAREHGVLDIHRVQGGQIVETWRYLNRRGRPHRRREVVSPR